MKNLMGFVCLILLNSAFHNVQDKNIEEHFYITYTILHSYTIHECHVQQVFCG